MVSFCRNTLVSLNDQDLGSHWPLKLCHQLMHVQEHYSRTLSQFSSKVQICVYNIYTFEYMLWVEFDRVY